jgi:phosphoserine phosphatase RsbU/P
MIEPKSLQQRLALFLLLPTALLLFAMGALGFVYARSALLSQWQDAVILRLQGAAHYVDMRLRHVKDWLELFHRTAGDTNAEILQEWVVEQLKGLEEVAQVKLTWTDEEPPNGASGQGLQERRGMHAGGRGAGRGWKRFQKARALDITFPRYDSIIQHQTVSLISDLYDESGRTVGRLEVAVSFGHLVADLLESSKWQDLKVFLVNNSGEVLTCNVPGGRHQLGAHGDPLELATLAALEQKPLGTLLGPGYPPVEVSGFCRLQEAPWSLVVIAPGREVLAPVIRFRNYYFIAGAVFIPLLLLLMRWVTGRTAAAIKEVSRAAEGIARGEHGSPLPVKTKDEVGQLTRSFNIMADQLEERMRLKEALDVAMEVQQSLLPQQPPEVIGLDIAGRSLYCDKTGGDYFDYLDFTQAGEDRIGIAVGDVVGHGIGAALLMTTVRALLRSRITQPGSCAQIVTDVNRLLCLDTASTGNFFTLFLAVIDPVKKNFRWVRAGHDPAILYDPATDSFTELRGEGMPLALGIDEAAQFQDYEYQPWRGGQIMLIGTDGIWETENPQSELFGKDRVRELIREHRGDTSQDILQAILDALPAFRQTAPQKDDVTLVLVKCAAHPVEDDNRPKPHGIDQSG